MYEEGVYRHPEHAIEWAQERVVRTGLITMVVDSDLKPIWANGEDKRSSGFVEVVVAIGVVVGIWGIAWAILQALGYLS